MSLSFAQAILTAALASTASDAASAVAGIGLIFFALALVWLPPDDGSSEVGGRR